MLRQWGGNCSHSLELIQERVHMCCRQQSFGDGVTQVCWRPYDVTISYQMLNMKETIWIGVCPPELQSFFGQVFPYCFHSEWEYLACVI